MGLDAVILGPGGIFWDGSELLFVVTGAVGVGGWVKQAGILMADHFHELERTRGRVTAWLGDEVLARSERTILLREFINGKTLDPVYYFPPEDVAVDKLKPSETRTNCPIKGDASYWTYSGGAGAEEDLVWGYLEPIASSRHIGGRMAFDARRVTFEVEPLDA